MLAPMSRQLPCSDAIACQLIVSSRPGAGSTKAACSVLDLSVLYDKWMIMGMGSVSRRLCLSEGLWERTVGTRQMLD
jgi:hypothetical protein